MKGIILAGGSGTRLNPITQGTSKQLLPIYNKPMVYYPLSVLMLAGINEIAVITTPFDNEAYKRLLGDGSRYGISIKYLIQDAPNGLAEAFIIAEEFINGDQSCLCLGDNFFYGYSFQDKLANARKLQSGALIFGYRVSNPEQFGVVEFDEDNKILSIEEKPTKPKSNYAATGLYFYDEHVCDIAKTITPSPRGELEITEINKIYLERNQLSVEVLGRGYTWLDSGTYDNLLEASQFVQTIEKRQGFQIACLEEIAYRNNWISHESLIDSAKSMKNSYGDYLMTVSENQK
ncbi:glucose-1-phosphate thymidylyltransferase RfbA [Gammaproteobacteria bacterium]|nr:glucose-1-phosphate thymidylyltransferase RfbA [Gammaproteobacteria bacterium]MDC0090023.1 glucose-1-phosphate thymidylyltransferase RfbA [Gammaproteobacteria bacterium]